MSYLQFGVSVVLSIINQGEEIHTNTSVIDIEQDVQFQWYVVKNHMMITWVSHGHHMITPMCQMLYYKSDDYHIVLWSSRSGLISGMSHI